MRDSVIDRYAGRVADPTKRPVEELDSFDNLGVFSILRGVRDRALMLELRMRDGSSHAFGYAYLAQASFDPSAGITLHFGGSTVHIIGTNLGVEVRPNVRLFQSLLRHRVPWIRETERGESFLASAKSMTIDEIRIDP